MVVKVWKLKVTGWKVGKLGSALKVRMRKLEKRQ
jgi:hypothetical protein